MKVRLIGPADLVKLWAARLELLGFSGQEYPARSPNELRWYAEIDDRVAANMVGNAVAVVSATAVGTVSAKKRRRLKSPP